MLCEYPSREGDSPYVTQAYGEWQIAYLNGGNVYRRLGPVFS